MDFVRFTTAFCGGNRASEHLSTLLPLPHQVKIHFYGHAHIGDYAWAKENAYRRISCVDWHEKQIRKIWKD